MTLRHFGYLLYRWHAYAGLFGGIFLIVICVSGSVAVFKPEIQRAVDWGGYDFAVEPVGDPISPSQALAVVEEKYPKAKATTLTLPALPGTMDSHGATYDVRLTGTAKGQSALDVLVDPYQAKVVAEARLNEGWGYWLRQLHLRLLYGQFWGRWVVGFFGLALAFATLSGLLIYTRFNANRWWPKLRIDRGRRVFWADVHKLVGMAALAFNLLFGATGAVLGLETLYDRYFNQPAAKAEPAAGEALPVKTVADTKNPGTKRPARGENRDGLAELPPGMLEACIARAPTLIPGSAASGVDLQYKRNGTLRVHVEHGALSLIKEGQSSVTFNARTGEPVQVVDASKASAAGRLYYATEPLHFGRLGGLMVIKLLWGLTGLTGGVLSITGYAIYVLRWRKKRAAKAAAATHDRLSSGV